MSIDEEMQKESLPAVEWLRTLRVIPLEKAIAIAKKYTKASEQPVEEPQKGDLLEISNGKEITNRGYSILNDVMYKKDKPISGQEWLKTVRKEGFIIRIVERNGQPYLRTKEQPVDCREAFEKWHNEEHGFVPSYGETCYDSEDSDALYDAFKGAWQHKREVEQPVSLSLVEEQLQYDQEQVRKAMQLLDTARVPSNGEEGQGKRQSLTLPQRIEHLLKRESVDDLISAAKDYFNRYVQDEADDVENCTCGEQQHIDAMALMYALQQIEAESSKP